MCIIFQPEIVTNIMKITLSGSDGQTYFVRNTTIQAMDNPSEDPVCVEGVSTIDFDSIRVDGVGSECTLRSVGPALDKTEKGAVTSIPLETLSVEEVCCLLDHSQLSAVTVVTRENQFSGSLVSNLNQLAIPLIDYCFAFRRQHSCHRGGAS